MKMKTVAENANLLGDDNASINTANDVSETMQTPKARTWMHLNIGIDWMRQFIEDGTLNPMTAFRPGIATKEKALKYLDSLERKGMKCLPQCDEVNDEGYCQGHIEKPKEKS